MLCVVDGDDVTRLEWSFRKDADSWSPAAACRAINSEQMSLGAPRESLPSAVAAIFDAAAEGGPSAPGGGTSIRTSEQWAELLSAITAAGLLPQPERGARARASERARGLLARDRAAPRARARSRAHRMPPRRG